MHEIAGPHRHRRCFRHPATMPEKAGVEVYRYARRSVRRRVHIWPEPRPRGVRIGVLRIIAAFSSNNDRTLRSAALPAFGVWCAMHVTRALVRRAKSGRCHWRRWRSHVALRVIQHMAVPAFACRTKRSRCIQRFTSRGRGGLGCVRIDIHRMPCGCAYDGGDGRWHRASPVNGRCQRRSAASTSDPAIQRKLAQCASSSLHRSCESSNW